MQETKAKSPKKRSLIDLLRVYGTGVIVAGIILVVAYQFVEPAPPLHFTLATGSQSGVYYRIASQYKDFLAQQGITLEILTSQGSVDNLRLLQSGDADVAFIQGGTASPEDYPDFEGLASLYFEPLWIFVRRDSSATTIADLSGSRLAVGANGSGTQLIARQILKDNGISETNATLIAEDFDSSARRLKLGQIDGLFRVSGTHSAGLEMLLMDPAITLLSLKRAAAYTRHHSFLSYVVLPEGAMDLAVNLPPEDIRLIAPAATLVTAGGLHPALIDQLMQASEAVARVDKSLLLTDTKFPSPNFLDFPLSSEAKRYFQNGPPFLQRYLPFWAATLVDRLKVMILPLIALILPIMKILPPTYRWRIRSRIYRWYDELHSLDSVWSPNSSSGEHQEILTQLARIENEVRQVEVPLSYAQELYTLRNHIDLLRRQISDHEQSPDQQPKRE